MRINPKAAWPLALAICSAASAQDVDPAALVKAAQATIRQIDEGSPAGVWEAMSSVVKQRVTRKDFTEATLRARQPLGTPGTRYWVAISRQQLAAATESVPAGMYSTVQFETLFQGNKAVRELVSFRLDEDKTWRASGYSVRVDAR
ncbi:DUF4019 domain-containing protein [Variovorax sp. RT4R15]|uniref:DUF4019 domain-containing protein n=1 Tax=Variovorax sp. RT4R15 TaxID=3443737 RepID=UPI003F477F7E